MGAVRYYRSNAMLRKFAILVVAAVTLVSGPARARSLYWVESTLACSLLDDARLLARSKISAKNERVGTGCTWLSTSNYLIDQVEQGFVCLHYSRRRCLWVPSRAIGGVSFDDGVF
jgi:hypothetical protein